MFEFLKTKTYSIFFSFLIGLFVIIVCRPICKGDDCLIHILPDMKEISSSSYQLGSKCFIFTPEVSQLAYK